MARTRTVFVEPLPRDALSLAQCLAIDATVFPFPSMLFERSTIDVSARVFVARAEPNGRVIGVLGAYLRDRALLVHGLAVDPDHRREGAGRALVRAAITDALRSRAKALHLQVSTTNGAAIALYESEGFEVARVKPGYYAAGIYRGSGDALEMVRLL